MTLAYHTFDSWLRHSLSMTGCRSCSHVLDYFITTKIIGQIMLNIAINGFGRIGKSFLRAYLVDPEAQKRLNIVVINVGKGDPEAAAFALKYDTLMGTLDAHIEYKDNTLSVNNHKFKIISTLDPVEANWKNYSIDFVVDATGHFTHAEDATKHLTSGAKKVLITAPAHGEDITIIPGVNDDAYNAKAHNIISLGSCTTNAVAPMIKIIDDNFNILNAAMTTVHAYTNTQPLLDVDATIKDLRKGRAAAINIVPTTTGASQVVKKLFPKLVDKFTAHSLRVPVPKVSLIDLVCNLEKKPDAIDINATFKTAAARLPQIIQYSIDPLVSSDYSGNGHSVIIDSLLTQTTGNICKIFGWYDNEWGYSERLKDFLLFASLQS